MGTIPPAGPDPGFNLQQAQDRLSRAWLDTSYARPLHIRGLLQSVAWRRIHGLAHFWDQPDLPPLDAAFADALIGLHAFHRASATGEAVLAYLYLVVGDGRETRLFAGIGSDPFSADLGAVLENTLAGSLPGIEFEPAHKAAVAVAAAPADLGAQLSAEGYFNHIAYLTGVPTRKLGRPAGAKDQPGPAGGGEQIDRLIRGMSGTKWGYLVCANPVPDQKARDELLALARQHTQASALLKATASISETPQNSQASAAGDRLVQTTANWSYEKSDRDAQRLMDLLDLQIERMETGRAEGLWKTWAYMFAADPVAAVRAATLARSAFGGAESRPEPLRAAAPNPHGTLDADGISTLLTSSELAALCAPPQQEANGYRVPEYSRFDVDAAPPLAGALPIGPICDGRRLAGNWMSIPADDLAKHALVVGVTGSGKTTTIFGLLHKLWSRAPSPIPCLVIEPAKTEYRRLSALGAFADLRVYTLGDERTAPFRLNPFEFDIVDENTRTRAQTHIDTLKSVFNAAFVLYAPMPYVLDIALHEVYQDRGWDLASGLNHRLPPGAPRGAERLYPVFPTLADLRRKVAVVVQRMGYEQRIEQDVSAGLQARIDSLRVGGKGLMLDVAHGIDLDELLSRPTVIELDRIGNDDEKAFLIGLLMARIAAWRRLQGNGPLRHVTVVEEAHRLLKNVDTEVGVEESSNKAAAVEVFVNMLSEVRAYGEGFIIAEQVPSKLAPDAIKNTNLKLMHRLLAQDDRDAVGAAINLNEGQSRRAVTLDPRRGEVIAFAEGCDRPYLLNVVALNQVPAAPPKDAVIAQRMDACTSGALYEPAPEFDALAAEPDRSARLRLRSQARELAADPALRHALIAYLFTVMGDPDQAVGGIVPVLQSIRRARAGQPAANETTLLVAVAVCAAAGLAREVGDLYGSPYPALERVRHGFVTLLNQSIRGFSPGLAPPARQQLMASLQPLIASLSSEWETLTRLAHGPLVGCAPCQARCRYRVAGEMLARDANVIDAIQEQLAARRPDPAYWIEVAAACQYAAGAIEQRPDRQAGIRVCLAAHFGHFRHGDNPAVQLKIARNVARESP